MHRQPDAPATRRNRDAILEVLKDELRGAQAVLEIGSGTGQHAVYFGKALPYLCWQTSDRAENHAGIQAWLDAEKVDNVLAPLDVDVLVAGDVPGRFDAVFSANTAHIMSLQAVARMFALVGRILPARGRFCLYGPFNVDGAFTSDSNEAFDRSLRAQDAEMGIRDLTDLDSLARESALLRVRQYAMPANNMLIVWEKQEEDR